MDRGLLGQHLGQGHILQSLRQLSIKERSLIHVNLVFTSCRLPVTCGSVLCFLNS